MTSPFPDHRPHRLRRDDCSRRLLREVAPDNAAGANGNLTYFAIEAAKKFKT